MESATQLDLLKERIEYDEKIFSDTTKYYGFVDTESNYIYTLNNIPNVGDMTYLYVEEEMILNKIISNVNTHEETIDDKTIVVVDSIVVDEVEYSSTNIVINVAETYIKVLKRLLEDSKYIALSLRYPYKDYSNIELPKKYYNWQLRCSQEIYQGIGSVGIKSYAENGLSWTRDSGYISYELRGEIEPMVGYIEEEIEESDDNG